MAVTRKRGGSIASQPFLNIIFVEKEWLLLHRKAIKFAKRGRPLCASSSGSGGRFILSSLKKGVSECDNDIGTD